jgi:hypothetical protein
LIGQSLSEQLGQSSPAGRLGHLVH